MTMTMTIDRYGWLPRLDWELAAGIWAPRAALIGYQALRAYAPFRTGALRESMDADWSVAAGTATISFFARAPYAGYVLSGTRPHPIAARNAKALRWTGRGGIGVNFARSVQHPGTKPDDFPERAMKTVETALGEALSAAVQESIGR